MVTQVKTVENDGYSAVQVGFVDKKDKVVNKDASGKKQIVHRHGVNKAEQGHFKKAGVAATRYLREFRLDDAQNYEVGQNIEVNVFEKGDSVDVTGTSKGHGYTSPILRWNQHTGPMAHGSKYHRGVGSLSANSDPSRVFKNKHMAGQWGNERVTVQNLEVVRVDGERNLLFVKGALPGPNGGLLLIRDSVKA